jgi:ABC-type transport system substrate-binding protein
MKFKSTSVPVLAAGLLFFGMGCSPKQQKKKEYQVVSWELADPQMLQPLISTELGATTICRFMFQQLIDIDFRTLELTPVLAEKRPVVEKTARGGMSLTFTIRKEARWDNGSPVTAKDVEFTLKAMLNPAVNNTAIKSTIDYISDITLYPDNPNKLTILCDTIFFLAEAGCGGYPIIPEYAYDPKGLMKGFTVPQLQKKGTSLINDPKIQEFATDMNSEKRMRDKNYISGSGPYQLEEWVTNQRVVLRKKANYWGDPLCEQVPYLAAYPDKLVFSTIKDLNSAISALKAGNLDVLYQIKAKEFLELKEDKKFLEKYNLYTPPFLVYYYLGFNTKNKFFSDKKTRQALSHLTDVDKIIKTIYYGLAERIVGPIHPSLKKEYNADIPLYDFNPEKAKALLAEAGWKDTNGDGTIDKVIDGVRTEFKITIAVNPNEVRKSIALMFQEDARKAGIEVSIVQQEWNTYLANLKKHNVEMFVNGWALSPAGNDLKGVWHSESTMNNGDNYVNFSNAGCDSLLDAIRTEINDDKRDIMYRKLQVIMHEEAPCVFLVAPTGTLAISKKFTNVVPSAMRPGFNPSDFKLLPAE